MHVSPISKVVGTAMLLAALGAPASADLVADCAALAPTVASTHRAILTMAVHVAAQGDAAIDLAGTRRRYGPSYKVIEDDAPLVDAAAIGAERTATDGLIAADAFTDPDLKATASALLSDYQTKATALQMYSHAALAFERAVNSKNRMAHLAAFDTAMAGLARPTVTTQSTTYGNATVSGNTVTGMANTTSTSTYNDPGALSRANASRAQQESGNAAVSVEELYPMLVQNFALVQNVPNAMRLEEARVKRMCPTSDFGDPAFGT